MRKHSGFTLLELMVVVVVFAVVLGAVMATLQTADEATRANTARTQAVEQTKNAIQRVSREIEESGLGTICCLNSYFRTVTQLNLPPAPGGLVPTPISFTVPLTQSVSDTRTFQSESGKQCASASCPWFFNNVTSVARYPQASLIEARVTTINTSTTITLDRYGRPWPMSFQSCPLDGSPLMNGTVQGSIRFLTPRDINNNFIMDEFSAVEASNDLQKKSDWQSMVFIAPFYNSDKLSMELRRYVIYKSDLYATSAQHTLFDSQQVGWTDWAANLVRDNTGALVNDLPTFIDLLDFGSNGTVDGIPDNLIPNRPEDSDAHLEGYLLTTTLTGSVVEGTIVWIKYLWDDITGKYRYWSLSIDRRTGQITWTVYFGNNNFAEFWYRSVILTRAPEVITNHVGAVDFSTNRSNPFVTTTNEGGVKSPDVVRVTFVLDREAIRRGARDIKESVLSEQVSPRNF